MAELCRRLDGIPLAIELTAARLRALTPEELLARLDDRFHLLGGGPRTAPPRQQTLQATIDWSYDLLTAAERRLFERLSVFAGGFTLDAVEAVCPGSGIDAAEVLDLLSRLVERSLVLAEQQEDGGATRYRLLETMRVYGLDRLAERGETDRWRERHARWITEMARRADGSFHGSEQGRWLRWAEREHDNARAALTWAVEHQETDLAVCLAAALWWSWNVHQRWSEGLEWAERVLALPHEAPTRERALLLVGANYFATFRGDLASNRPAGNRAAARHRIEACLAIGEALADDELVFQAYGMSEFIREFGFALEGAPERSPEELKALARRIGYTWGEGRELETIARRALRAGELDTAAAQLHEAAGLAREVGDTWSLAMTLNQLGDIERVRGAHPPAGALYEESLALFAELGLGAQPSLVHNLGYVALAAGDRAGAAVRFTEALHQFRRRGEQRGTAECLIGLGAVAAATGRSADAGRLFGAGDAALAALGTRLWPSNGPDYARWRAVARSGREAARFDRGWTEGQTLSLEQAIARAVERTAAASSTPAADAAAELWLTPREREVASLAAGGLSNRAIAAALVISERTAANYLQRVFDKLDLRSRAQLAARAAALGLGPAGAPPHTATAQR